MDTGLYMGVNAMRLHEKRIEAIATNLANVNTHAYKRQSTAAHSFELPNAKNSFRPVVAQTTTDFTQGILEQRSDPLSLALDGEGFFTVETEDGEAYTRNGDFHLDEAGELKTREGFAVAWTGQRGRVQPTGQEITIDGVGRVRQGINDIGQLKLVDFADKQALKLDSSGYFHAPQGLEQRPADGVLHQQALERSNAEAVDELVGLIKAQRGFETAANVMRTLDQSYRRLTQQR